MSNAGKSLICAALCRIFKQDGYKVAPFKSQNMALNSFITDEGLEMGRAQVVQAEAAGIKPSVLMNPILLKPTTDVGSQVIVNGEVRGNMRAADYFKYKKELIPDIMRAYNTLAAENDIIVIEGAGSPAEINLKSTDIVNMGMAKMVNAPVLLVGDIDRGGVFAQLYGTVALLEDDERAMVKATVINKFRGDVKILEPGLDMLYDLVKVPCAGVVPYTHVDIDDEDSLSERLTAGERKEIDIAVISLPRISNFTDFNLLGNEADVSVYYATRASELQDADIIILPGTKNTIEDLNWLKQHGLADEIIRHSRKGGMVIGICGGYQMLGQSLHDPLHTESRIPEMAGLGLLDFSVTFNKDKTTVQANGVIDCEEGWMQELNGILLDGYEIHSGVNTFGENCVPFLRLNGREEIDGITNKQGNIIGSYLHGIFDTGSFWRALINRIRVQKGMDINDEEVLTIQQFRDREFDRLASIVRQNIDMESVYKIVRGEDVPCGRWDND